MNEEYVDVAGVADLVGVSRATAWKLLQRHNLTRYRIPTKGKRTFVRKSDLEVLRQPVPITKAVPPRGKATA